MICARSNWLRLALAATLALVVGVACANRQTRTTNSSDASSGERLDRLEHDLYSLEHDPIFAEDEALPDELEHSLYALEHDPIFAEE